MKMKMNYALNDKGQKVLINVDSEPSEAEESEEQASDLEFLLLKF